jgi:hypothetical protein
MKKKLSIKPKIKTNKGKAKGNNFQWEIAKKLSLAVSDKDDIFIPTADSGSRGTRRSKTKETQITQHGDISFEDIIGKPLIDIWNIECKSGYTKITKTKTGVTKTGWCMLDCIEGSDNPKFLEFWLQCLDDAEITKREPILIFRRANKQPCITFEYRYFYDVLKPLSNKLFKEWDYDSISLNIGKEVFLTMSFPNFLDWVNGNLLEFAKNVNTLQK